MGLDYFSDAPVITQAYSKSSSDEYFGWADAGATVLNARWKIVKMHYFNSTDWIFYFPVDTTTGLASAESKFIWESMASTYCFATLGTPS